MKKKQPVHLVDVRSGAGREPLGGQVVEPGEGLADVLRPHVLGGVDAEPCDAPIDERVHELGDLLLDPVRAALQVPQTHQHAVAYL